MKTIHPQAEGHNTSGVRGSEIDMSLDGIMETNSGGWNITQAPSAVVTDLQPEPTGPSSARAQTDPRYSDIGTVMPSSMGFYPGFDTLAIRTMSPRSVEKMHRAVSEQSFRHQVDAISACLDHTAYDLTIGDMQYTMYWLRLNSFKKNPVKVNWACANPDHLARVGLRVEHEAKLRSGELEQPATLNEGDEPPEMPGLAPETLTNVTSVQKAHLVEKRLNFDECDQFMRSFFNEYGLYLWTPLVSDLVEGIEEKGVTEELDYWNKYAGLLNPLHHGRTLKERRDYIMKFMDECDSADVLTDMERWSELCEHGVEEMIEVECYTCQAKDKAKLRIDPLSFLPQLQAKK